MIICSRLLVFVLGCPETKSDCNAKSLGILRDLVNIAIGFSYILQAKRLSSSLVDWSVSDLSLLFIHRAIHTKLPLKVPP